MPHDSQPKRRRSTPRSDYRVFISHATSDKWIAKRICEQVESVGATTFRDDRDIAGGDSIPDEIRNAIKRSQEILILLTPESVNRPWILLETGMALGWRKNYRINVVLCHVEANPIPDMLKDRKAIRINEFDGYLEELTVRVQRKKP